MIFKRFASSVRAESVESVLKYKNYQVTTYARDDKLCITRGSNDKLYDDINGKEYIDFTAGIAVTSLGHSNPKIAQIMAAQSAKLMHSSNLYYNEESLKLGQNLVEATKKFGGQHDASKVFLCNSGTEANEAALKFAKKLGIMKNPSKQGIVAFENAFHGRTMGALSATWNSKYRTPFGDLVPHFQFLNINDDITKLQDYLNLYKEKIAGLIVEPIQGEGGVMPISPQVLNSLKQICVKNDILVIYDEIQCGLGRSGKLWAHSHLPVEAHPDIFTVAKALGNGFPIAATVVNEKVNNGLKVGDHGTTYGGNPLGCAISNYVVSEIANEDFLDKVMKKSSRLQGKLEKIAKKYPGVIKDVRGKGLMIGVEFAENPAKVVDVAKNLGLLIITAGMNTVRFVPALTIEDSTLDEGLKIFEKAVEQTYKT